MRTDEVIFSKAILKLCRKLRPEVVPLFGALAISGCANSLPPTSTSRSPFINGNMEKTVSGTGDKTANSQLVLSSFHGDSSSGVSEYNVACAPVGTVRTQHETYKVYSLGRSPQDVNVCRLETPSGTRESFLISMNIPAEGKREGAQAIRSVIAHPGASAEVEMSWFNGATLMKGDEKFINLGLRTRQMKEGPLQVMVIRQDESTIIGPEGEGVIEFDLPVIDNTVYLMPIAQRIPDQTKTYGGSWKPWSANSFVLPRPAQPEKLAESVQ